MQPSVKTASCRAGALLLMVAACLLPVRASELAPWPPRDPGQPQAKPVLSTRWAASLRDLRDFASLQRAAGSAGKLLAIDGDPQLPRAVYGWHGRGGRGRMTAFVYRNGDFAVTIAPVDGSGEITMNNAGAFVCPGCSPPVNACGHRPSWVSHEVHWDAFDCHCTITGPQTIKAGPC